MTNLLCSLFQFHDIAFKLWNSSQLLSGVSHPWKLGTFSLFLSPSQTPSLSLSFSLPFSHSLSLLLSLCLTLTLPLFCHFLYLNSRSNSEDIRRGSNLQTPAPPAELSWRRMIKTRGNNLIMMKWSVLYRWEWGPSWDDDIFCREPEGCYLCGNKKGLLIHTLLTLSRWNCKCFLGLC